jgi:hypothetical protein
MDKLAGITRAVLYHNYNDEKPPSFTYPSVSRRHTTWADGPEYHLADHPRVLLRVRAQGIALPFQMPMRNAVR